MTTHIHYTHRSGWLRAAVLGSNDGVLSIASLMLADIAAPENAKTPVIAIVSLLFLITLGALAARVGGASVLRGATRVLIWGALAMGVTSLIGSIFGAVV